MGALRLVFYAIICGIGVSAFAEWLKGESKRAMKLPSFHYDSLTRAGL